MLVFYSPHRTDETLDYTFDYSRWLTPGDSISSATVTITPSDLVIQRTVNSVDAVTIWISGGLPGVYSIKVYAVTVQGRTIDRTAQLKVITP